MLPFHGEETLIPQKIAYKMVDNPESCKDISSLKYDSVGQWVAILLVVMVKNINLGWEITKCQRRQTEPKWIAVRQSRSLRNISSNLSSLTFFKKLDTRSLLRKPISNNQKNQLVRKPEKNLFSLLTKKHEHPECFHVKLIYTREFYIQTKTTRQDNKSWHINYCLGTTGVYIEAWYMMSSCFAFKNFLLSFNPKSLESFFRVNYMKGKSNLYQDVAKLIIASCIYLKKPPTRDGFLFPCLWYYCTLFVLSLEISKQQGLPDQKQCRTWFLTV